MATSAQMTYDEAKDYVDRKLPRWKPKPLVHTCPFPPGKLRIRFYRRWPFVRIWRQKTICLCDVMAILDEIKAAPVQAPRLP